MGGTEMSLKEQLCTWFNEQPVWVRNAVNFLLHKEYLDDSEIERLADICEKQLNIDSSEEVIKVKNFIRENNKNEFSILEIGDVKGVNAIYADKPLVFDNEGINIVYGQNGSGKSSYIRILKMISGSKNREVIKNDIYQEEIINPTCRIKIKDNNGKDKEIIYDLKEAAKYEILENIDIFDDKVANEYIRDSKEASYEPWIFHLLKELITIADKIKKELENRKSKVKLIDFNIPKELENLKLCKEMKKLKYNSNKKIFDIKWSELDEKKLTELETKLRDANSKLKLEKVEKEEKSLNVLLKYMNSFKAFYDKVNLNVIEEHAKKFHEAFEEKKATRLLFSETVEDLDKKSISNVAWINLWKSAQRYYEKVLVNECKKYTETDGICPLCHQKITAVNCNRMKIINEYVNGDISEKLIRVRNKYLGSLKTLPLVKAKSEIKMMLDNSSIVELNSEIQDINNNLLELKGKIDECDKIDSEGNIEIIVQKLDLSEITGKISKIIGRKKIEYLDIKALEKKENKEELKRKISEEKEKKFVAEIKDKIIKQIENLEKINLIELAIKLTSTKRLTSKGKELAKRLLTEKYINRFNEELEFLTKNKLKVELKEQRACKGVIPYKIILLNKNKQEVNTEEILSDGEKRAVSLAAFFAEASNREEKCPLIFDDPISSLDYDYENKVVERLLQASKHRQVIVFTHRISLAVGISEKAEINDVKCFQKVLLADENVKGNPRSSNYFKGNVKKQINSLIKDDFNKLRKTDKFSQDYNIIGASLCQSFRNCVEKSVEEILINGVVKRFRRDIQTKNRLANLVNITKEDCYLIEKMMTEYSEPDHSSSDETPFSGFDLEKIGKDLNEFNAWIEMKKSNA